MPEYLCTPSSYAALAAIFLLCLGGILGVGTACAAWLTQNGWVRSVHLTPLVAVGGASLVGYAFFWAFLYSTVFGRLLSVGLALGILIAVTDRNARSALARTVRDRDVWIPFCLMALIGMLYFGVTYLGVFNRNVCAATDVMFVTDRLLGTGSPDYLIQKMWVDGLFRGSPPWNNVLDPDLSRTTVADRPPLLAGIALSVYSLIPEKLQFYYFMAITSAASMGWVAAVWALARISGLPPTRAMALVLSLGLTYYFWFSSMFTWPKALSGALYIGAFVLLVLEPYLRRQRADMQSFALGSAFAALSMVAHFSAGLLLLVTALFLLAPRIFPGIRNILIGLVVFSVITGSYMWVKGRHETNLSNQTKYTFSVPDTEPVEPLEYKGLSTVEAIRKAYEKLSWTEIASYKAYNVGSIFRLGCFLACDGKSLKEGLWSSELIPILGSMKWFNLGWLLFLPLAFLRASGPLADTRNTTAAVSNLCLALAFAGLLIYALASFRQGVSNILSTGFTLLLFCAAGVRLFSMPWRPLGIFSALSAAYFVTILAGVAIEDQLKFNLPMLPFVIAPVLVAAWMLFATRRAETRQLDWTR